MSLQHIVIKKRKHYAKNFKMSRWVAKNMFWLAMSVVALFGIFFLFNGESAKATATNDGDCFLYFLGNRYYYKDFNSIPEAQSYIDKHPSYRVATVDYGPDQDNFDGESSYFIGHSSVNVVRSSGVFDKLFKLQKDDPIIVHDYKGTDKTYYVSEIYQADDHNMLLSQPGVSLHSKTMHTHQEQIVLQTCITNTENLIIIAK
jgi:hypothetical protein